MTERMQQGLTGGTSGPQEAQDREEQKIWRDAGVFRFLEKLQGRQKLHVPGLELPALRRLARLTGQGEGYLVVGCLRRYQEWGTRSPERALLAVYEWLSRLAPASFRPLPAGVRPAVAKKARQQALELYSDCYLALRTELERL